MAVSNTHGLSPGGHVPDTTRSVRVEVRGHGGFNFSAPDESIRSLVAQVICMDTGKSVMLQNENVQIVDWDEGRRVLIAEVTK